MGNRVRCNIVIYTYNSAADIMAADSSDWDGGVGGGGWGGGVGGGFIGGFGGLGPGRGSSLIFLKQNYLCQLLTAVLIELCWVIQNNSAKIKQDIGDAPLNNLR